LFRFTKFSHIAEVLTLNDVLYWGGDSFISVILALFITQYISGATASSVGVSYMIYRISSSISTVYIGKMFDRIKGFSDEIWALFLVSLVVGITYVGLSFATELWHLYSAMVILGVCRAVDINSWKLIFYSHLEKNTRGRTIGTYDAIFGIAIGALSALSGFVGEIYGFRMVVLVAGIIVFLGGFPVLSLRSDKTI